MRIVCCVLDAVRPWVAGPPIQVYQRGGRGKRADLHAVRRTRGRAGGGARRGRRGRGGREGKRR